MAFTTPFAPLAEVQTLWNEAQPYRDRRHFDSVNFDHLPPGPFALADRDLIHAHVVAAATAMGFAAPCPTVDGLNERADGRLRLEELLAEHVERSYPRHGGCELAAEIRDGVHANPPSLFKQNTSNPNDTPNPGWVDAVAGLLKHRAGVPPVPTVTLEPYFHISWRQWLLCSQPELELRGVPGLRVAALRLARTGHDNNMHLPPARTIGDWGGVRTEAEIAERTFQELSRVQSYKKMRERRVGGKAVLKTSIGGVRRSQAELAWLVADQLLGRAPHDVSVRLGILRIEYKLYQEFWQRILLRSHEYQMDSPERRLRAAEEIAERGALSVHLAREHWGI